MGHLRVDLGEVPGLGLPPASADQGPRVLGPGPEGGRRLWKPVSAKKNGGHFVLQQTQRRSVGLGLRNLEISELRVTASLFRDARSNDEASKQGLKDNLLL